MALHFGLRGSEVFTKLKKTDLSFEKDGKSEYVVLKGDFNTKNTPGGLSSREFHNVGMIRDEIQVKAVRRLLSILHPSEDRVFQRALAGCRSKDGNWFARAPLGHNSIANIVPKLSVRANLSMRYTNHCVRATVVTTLKDAGYNDHEVQAITGHKNPASIAAYDRLDRADCKRPSDMAKALDGAMPSTSDREAQFDRQRQTKTSTFLEKGLPTLVSAGDGVVVQNITVNVNVH